MGNGKISRQLKVITGLMAVYEKFIVKIFNALGLENRATLVLKGICFAEETDYLVKQESQDNFYTSIGGDIKIIDKGGTKSILRTWSDEDYKNVWSIKS